MKKIFLLLSIAVSVWSRESSLDARIDQFFQEFNEGADSKNPHQLGVHFLGSQESDSKEILEEDSSRAELSGLGTWEESIDEIQGGLRAANSERLKKGLEGIPSGSVYPYLISLEATSPLLGSVFKQIQTWANQLNAVAINSSEMARLMAPGQRPKIERASAYISELALMDSGKAADLIEARGLPGKVKELALKAAVKRNPDLFAGQLNTAAKVLSLMGIDRSRRDFLMTLTGTIVVDGEGGVETYPSQYKQAIDYLCVGKPLKNGYAVKGNGIDVEKSEVDLGQDAEAFGKARVFAVLKEIQQKLLNEEEGELTNEAQKILNAAPFPMGSLISLLTQYQGSGASLVLERLSGLIAAGQALQFSEEAALEILHKAHSLKMAQIGGAELDAYGEMIEEVLRGLADLKAENVQKMNGEFQAIDYLIKIDQALREKEA